MPRTWAIDTYKYTNSAIIAITGDGSSVYTGGRIAENDVAGLDRINDGSQSVVERTDLPNNNRVWIVAYDKNGGAITSLALGPKTKTGVT